MDRSEIKKIINDFFVEELEIKKDLIADNASLKNDLGIDSLDFVDIVVVVEQRFGFKIKAEEMADVKTLGQFYDYIEQKLQTKEA